jgi:hypothetical protein
VPEGGFQAHFNQRGKPLCERHKPHHGYPGDLGSRKFPRKLRRGGCRTDAAALSSHCPLRQASRPPPPTGLAQPASGCASGSPPRAPAAHHRRGRKATLHSVPDYALLSATLYVKSQGGSDPRMILNEEEPGDGAEWLKISLTASSSRRDEVFGRDTTKEGFA